MRLAIDIDGVLAQFNLAYAYYLISAARKDRFPEGWKHYPERLCPVWNWEYHWGYTEAERAKAWEWIEARKSTFWLDLPLMPLAKDAIWCLNKLHLDRQHDVYFLTHRPGYEAKLQTERWLYKHGYAYPDVLIVDAAKKWQVLKALDIDVFIDDKLDTVRSAIGHAKRVYLQDQPYNQVPVLMDKNAAYTRVKTIQHMLEAEGVWEEHPMKQMMFWRKPERRKNSKPPMRPKVKK